MKYSVTNEQKIGRPESAHIRILMRIACLQWAVIEVIEKVVLRKRKK